MALSVCTALRVLCVAEDAGGLTELKHASVSAEWELAPGATDEAEALRQLREEQVHVVVVFGPFEAFVRRALATLPTLRVVADRPAAGGERGRRFPQGRARRGPREAGERSKRGLGTTRVGRAAPDPVVAGSPHPQPAHALHEPSARAIRTETMMLARALNTERSG